MRRAVVALLLAAAIPARADVSGRISLTGMVLRESQDETPDPRGGNLPADASPMTLLYGDLRGVVEGRHLPGGLAFKADLRLRLTSDFSQADAILGTLSIGARGYSGGREYDLREAWIGHRGERFEIAAGRLLIPESDALRLDGVRLGWRFSGEWRASLYGGLYPDPYSRSVTDNYRSTSALAGAAGAAVAYDYPRIWGTASASAVIAGGPDDGGPIDPNGTTPVRTEAPRVYLTWTNYLRIASFLDLFHDLVVDVAGPAGVVPTRADVLAHVHASRLQLVLGYGHLSALATEMYLSRLLQDRQRFLPGTVENNLIVQRTARDEGRIRADVRAAGHLHVFGEGRIRRRALVEAGLDPNFPVADSPLAYEVGGGLRSAGDLAGMRIGAAFTYLRDFRAETKLVAIDAGRDLAGDRLSLDAGFLWEGIRDGGLDAAAPCDPAGQPLAPACFGRRSGSVYQGSLTLAARPTPRWFLLADYRLVVSTPDGANSLFTHVALLRLEVRL